MIITAILQTRNEESSGHLVRFLKWNMPIIDNLVAYDDCSTDKTVDLLKASGAEVIVGSFHSFQSELHIKDLLLRRALELFPETTWVLWLDADELLLESRDMLNELLLKSEKSGFDGIQLPLVNLWRSETYFRVDSGYNQLENVRFWRNNGKLHFEAKPGLHLPMHPQGIEKVSSLESPRILHFGFSSDKYIISKFMTYQKSGQRARNLWRLVDESTLELNSIFEYEDQLGQRFTEYMNLTIPTHNEIFKNTTLLDECHFVLKENIFPEAPTVTLLSQASPDTGIIEFQYSELLRIQNELGAHEVEILFVASEKNIDSIEYLQLNRIPYVLTPGDITASEEQGNVLAEQYMHGVMQSKGKLILLTQQNLIYSSGFIVDLLMKVNEKSVITCKKVNVSSRFLAISDIPRLIRSSKNSLVKRLFLKSKVDTNISMPLLAFRNDILHSNIVKSKDFTILTSEKAIAYNFYRLANKVKKSPRVHVIYSPTETRYFNNTLLVTDDIESVRHLKKNHLKNLVACVTSNPEVLNQMALKNDVHCYFVENINGVIKIDFAKILDEIVTQEIRHTFMPKVDKSFRSKVLDSLPPFARSWIRGFRSLFRPR